MSLKATTYRIVHDVYFRLNGYRSPQIWRSLEESQWWSRKEIQELQDRSLQKLIKYVYKYVPYYRSTMDEHGLKPKDIKKTGDLVKLPVLTKELLSNNRSELISTQTDPNKASFRNTGGSTGEPLQIMNDRLNDAWESAALRRGYGFAGYKIGEPFIKLFGGTMGLRPESLWEKLATKFSNTFFLPAYEISQETIGDYVRRIRQSKAKYLTGYTSAMYLLVKLMEDAKLNISLKAVFPTAENLYDFQKETIEKLFQCEVFNLYGCAECNSIAFECMSHNGLHVSDEHVFLEALDGKERVPDGEMGALTLTTLHRYMMPLIRYQNKDIVSINRTPCSCGRNLSKISKIYGRSIDLLLAQDGRLIPGLFVSHLFRDTIGIKQFQVIQEERDIIHVKIVKGLKFEEGELESIFEAFHQYLGGVKIKVEYVTSISRTPQGKIKYVISKFGDKLLY